jgi:antitoxin HicB
MATGATELPGKHHDPGYHISIAREEGSEAWTARVEELAGCVAEGATPDEAAERVRAAMDDWIAEAVAAKRKLPEPRASSSHSGHLLLRMPQSLHAELARAAEREDVSLNQFITGSLASAVGWGRVGDEPRRGEPGERGRLLPLAIAANTVVVIVATVIALVLLIIALREGF